MNTAAVYPTNEEDNGDWRKKKLWILENVNLPKKEPGFLNCKNLNLKTQRL